MHWSSKVHLRLMILAMGIMATSLASGNSLSFTGNFKQDDDIQLISFSVKDTSSVILRTWSYAGGQNAAGASVAPGGFDPVLTLFSSTGLKVGENDDAGCKAVPADKTSGNCWDSFLQLDLTAGSYIVSLTQADNFAIGANFSDGFLEAGQGNFTTQFGSCRQFNDLSDNSGGCRSNQWSLDVLGDIVQEGNVEVSPEPSPVILIGIGLTAFTARIRSKAISAHSNRLCHFCQSYLYHRRTNPNEAR